MASRTGYGRVSQNRKTTVVPVNFQLPEAHEKQWELINSFELFNARFVIGAAGTKFGKRLTLDTPIPTTKGWKLMGDIKTGDYVFDEHGAPVIVLFVSDVVNDGVTYEVVFSDGSKIKADAEHLWLTQTHAARKAAGRKSTIHVPSVVTTEQIRATLQAPAVSGGKVRPNHSVDVVSAAVQFPAQELPVDPYVLGAWLGNGTACSGDVTGISEEVLCAINAAGYERYMVPSRLTGKAQTWSFKGFRTALRMVGVLNNKHVPSNYLIGSPEQRLALVQGLMDTDGTVDSRGHCCFDNTNKNLADSIDELLCSLGVKVNRTQRYGKLYGVQKKLCYRVNFTTDIPVFRIKWKLDRLRPIADKARRRYIVAVNRVEAEPAKCIGVNSPSSLFLCGKSFIPTHNTFGCILRIIQEAWNNKGSRNWWVAPTFSQSELAYDTILNMLPKGSYQEFKADLKIVILTPEGDEWSKIEFKSGEKESSLRGFAVDFFVIDEAARVKPASILSVMTTVTQTFGRGLIISTPLGRGPFYELYQRGEKYDSSGRPRFNKFSPDPYAEYYSIRMPTWENPHVLPIAIRQAKKIMTEDEFRQEIGAQFLNDSAGVFRGVTDCIRGSLFIPPMPGRRYVMGVDLARLRDYTVIVVMDQDLRHVVYFERFNKISWELQMSKIKAVSKRYGNAPVCMDASGLGDPIVQFVIAQGVNVRPYKITGSSSKQALVDKLRLNIAEQSITFPENVYTRDMLEELRAFEYKYTESGKTQFEAPRGKHDDTVIALAMAVWILDDNPSVFSMSLVAGI